MVTIGRLRPGGAAHLARENETRGERAACAVACLSRMAGWPPSRRRLRRRQWLFTQKGDNGVQASPFTFLRRILAPPVTDAPRMARTCDAPTQSPSPFQTHDGDATLGGYSSNVNFRPTSSAQCLRPSTTRSCSALMRCSRACPQARRPPGSTAISLSRPR